VADGWLKGNKEWLFDQFDLVDAQEAERLVDQGGKTLNGVIRIMKDKQIDTIRKIAEGIKKQIDEFKPKVPLLVAMRNKGMTNRH